jgi:hypothetical protein
MRALQVILPLVLPAAVYFAWLGFMRWRARTSGSADIPLLREGPWYWLISAGLVLAIATFLMLAFFGERVPAGQYVPPRLIDDQVVPAHRAPAD